MQTLMCQCISKLILTQQSRTSYQLLLCLITATLFYWTGVSLHYIHHRVIHKVLVVQIAVEFQLPFAYAAAPS